MDAQTAQLLVRVLCDVLPPGALEAAYFYGQTPDNEASVLEAACDLWRDGVVQRVFISSSEPRSGYSGFGPWYTSLRRMGVPEDCLFGVPVSPRNPEAEDYDVLHTYREAESFIAMCRDRGFSHVGVVATPFHQLRAFVSAVSVAAKEYRSCRIYSVPGKSLAWDENVVHHQGKEVNSRMGFVATELERLMKYHLKGDLLSVEEVLSYLENRDRIEPK